MLNKLTTTNKFKNSKLFNTYKSIYNNNVKLHNKGLSGYVLRIQYMLDKILKKLFNTMPIMTLELERLT